MAGDLNKIVLIGRLTRDPETRQISTGTSVCSFSIANNRVYTQNGEKKEEVSYFNCKAWGRLGEVVQKYCQKGKQVAIDGSLRQNTWQDKEGKKQYSVEINVENLQMLGGNSGGDSSKFSSSKNIPEDMNSPPNTDMHNSSYANVTTMDDDDVPF